jgi:hypothetical protein
MGALLMKKLPFEVKQFEALRRNGYYYVDKTPHLYRLAMAIRTPTMRTAHLSRPLRRTPSLDPHFLARPPLFGKTLLVSALEAVLRGRRELFEGLWIEGSDYDWEPMPVIGLRVGEIEAESPDELKKALTAQLKKAAELVGLDFRQSDPSEAFEELIKSAAEKSGLKAAILIDGYDAPILSKICRPRLARDLLRVMGPFLRVLGSARKHLGPAFVTGTTMLSGAILSNGVDFIDISFDKEYAGICGFTAKELGALLKDRPGRGEEPGGEISIPDSFIASGALPPKATLKSLRERMISEMSGYSWDGRTRLVNPFSAVSALFHRRFGDDWFPSLPHYGPKALLGGYWKIYEIARDRRPSRPGGEINLRYLSAPDLFFQAGFLTVDEEAKLPNRTGTTLRLPNPMIEAAVFEAAMGLDSGQWLAESRALGREMLEALASRDASRLESAYGRLGAAVKELPPKAGNGYRQNLVLLALEAAGQSFETSEVIWGRLKTRNFPGLVICTALLRGEIDVRYVGLERAALSLADEDLDRKMEMKAQEALGLIERKKRQLGFIGKPEEIWKCALVFGPGWKILAVFEEAKNWSLSLNEGGRYAAQEN